MQPSSPVPSKPHTTIITLSDCNDSDYYSSSFETTYNNNAKSKPINIYNNIYHSNSNSNSIINESTDYMQSDTDDLNNTDSADHNYDYPWPTSSDDSFANLSETEVYEKLRIKLSQQIQQKQLQTPSANVSDSKPKINLIINTNLKPQLPQTVPKGENSLSLNETNEKIDSKYYDFRHQRYMSVIIHTTAINDINYGSEYEGDNESEYDENETNIKPLNVTPIQSTCETIHSDLLGCNLTDLEN